MYFSRGVTLYNLMFVKSAQRFIPTACCLSVSPSMRVFIGGRSDHQQHDY